MGTKHRGAKQGDNQLTWSSIIKSHSDEKRPFCAVPARAIADKTLSETDRRLLMALGYYANRAGVCWPSIRTLVKITGMGANTVQRALGRLLNAGYVRRLRPNDYNQKEGAWGHSNRYQVLWRANDPIPTWEHILEANKLQPKAEQMSLDTEGLGVRGVNNHQLSIHMQQLAGAWAAATERSAGFRPVQPPPMADLAALAADNIPPSDLAKATAELTDHRIKIGLGIPSFKMVIDNLKTLATGQNDATRVAL